MKTCTKCHVQKPLEGFYKAKGVCKVCLKGKRDDPKTKAAKTLYNKEYFKKNIDKERLRNKVYSSNNRKKINIKKNFYRRKRYKVDKEYYLKRNLRARIRLGIKNKSTTTVKLIGCTWEYLKPWLESQMTDTMTFDIIHIDHMMPLASFDLTKPEEQRKACHYTNLQPMLPSENLSKGSKIVHDMRWNGQQWEINRSGIYELRDKNIK